MFFYFCFVLLVTAVTALWYVLCFCGSDRCEYLLMPMAFYICVFEVCNNVNTIFGAFLYSWFSFAYKIGANLVFFRDISIFLLHEMWRSATKKQFVSCLAANVVFTNGKGTLVWMPLQLWFCCITSSYSFSFFIWFGIRNAV